MNTEFGHFQKTGWDIFSLYNFSRNHFFIPNNMDTLIAEQRLYEETIAELEEELDEQQEDIENNEELDTAIKEDLLSMLDELKR